MLSSFEHLVRLLHPIWQLLTAILFCTLPLWWLFRRWQMDPLTKLLVTVLGNFIVLYLLEFGAYILSLPQWVPMLLLLISFVYSVIILIQQRSDFSWNGLFAWMALSIWILGLQGWISAYGAASWYGDWYEHYERSIWFLDQQSSQHKFLLGMWPLAARGPLFNAICAILMNSGDDFASYQVFATVLNTFPVLALGLLIRDIAGFKQSSALIWSVLICGLAPFAVQQETYTWTKFFTAGIILSAIYLYKLGLSENKTLFVGLGFGAFAVAILSHYLSVLFTLFFVLHFFFIFRKRKWKPQFILAIILGCSILLVTWFGYIFSIFGFQKTLESTSTFGTYGKRQQGSQIEVPPWSIVFAGNMVTTTIPYSWRQDWKDTWRGIGMARRLTQRDIRMGEKYYPSENELDLRAEWFAHLVTYPNSLLGAIGFAGIIGLIVTGLRLWRRGFKPASAESSTNTKHSLGAIFWIIFFAAGIPLNILASRDYSAIGLAHLNLQPFILLVAVFLLRQLNSLPVVSFLLVLVFLVESTLISAAWISLQHRKLPISVRENGEFVVTAKVHADAKYVSNYLYKLQTKAVYLSDKLGRLKLTFFLMTTAIAVCIVSFQRAGLQSKNPQDAGIYKSL